MGIRLSRRLFVAGSSALAISGPALPLRAATSDGVVVTGLRTEAMPTPLGVESLAPRLSWRMESSRRGVRQTAYRIRVASSAEALASGGADLWDSGRVASGASIGIRYAGTALASRQRAHWLVEVWDETGQSSRSEASWWEMGLLKPSDWSAAWIGAEDDLMRADRMAGFTWLRGPSSSATKPTAFRLPVEILDATEATLFVVRDGEANVWLDGAQVDVPATGVPLGLAPAMVVTMKLAAGKHVIGVTVGAGRIGALLGFKGTEVGLFLRLTHADGKITRPAAAGWRTGASTDVGWSTTSFDAAPWAAAEKVTDPRPTPWPKQPGILMRRGFTPAKPIRAARLYATALGGYHLELNGRPVGTTLLAPESGDYRKRLLYRVHDVTDLLRDGANVLGATVGDGWYASYTMGTGRFSWGPAPRRLIAQLEILYADGSRETIGTDEQWRLSRSSVLTSEIYDGEDQDGRLDQPGWSTAGFDAGRWTSAHTTDAPPCRIEAQISPPITAEQTMKPVAITEPKPGMFVVDFGQNFAGWCRLRAKGAVGAKVELRFAELLTKSGEADQSNLRAARAADTYILRGEAAGESFEPRFTYHGFRYVQVDGFPGRLTPADIDGVVVHSATALTGDLKIENPLIAALWHNAVWSQRSNFMGIPTDCPQRDERLGWMGDANVFWDAAAFNMDVEAFTRKWMGDVRDAQADNGAFADFSPAPFRLPSSDGKIGAAPGWADAGVCLPWTVWKRYGDPAIIDENWEAMTRYLDFIKTSNPDLVWRKGRGSDYGDWLALDAKQPGDPTTPKDLVGTATWAHSVDCMAEMAEATGRKDDAATYRALWTSIAAAFRTAFVKADGSVGNGSQTGYILALRYRLVPDDMRERSAALLAADIKRRGTLLSTGFLGTPNSLDVLADAGLGSLVYDLLLRTEFPSWGYMVAKGATTIWERWNGDTGDLSMNSFNHYALGAVSGFMFRRIAGIAPLDPGFRRIAIEPVLDPRVAKGGADYRSAMGPISTRWEQRSGGALTLDVSIPANTTALVTLPLAKGRKLIEGGTPVAGDRHLRVLKNSGGQVSVEVASGDYRFAVV